MADKSFLADSKSPRPGRRGLLALTGFLVAVGSGGLLRLLWDDVGRNALRHPGGFALIGVLGLGLVFYGIRIGRKIRALGALPRPATESLQDFLAEQQKKAARPAVPAGRAASIDVRSDEAATSKAPAPPVPPSSPPPPDAPRAPDPSRGS